ncbi:MAG: DUF899 domain-containing protein [Candidatus Nitrosocosmicus sp.]
MSVKAQNKINENEKEHVLDNHKIVSQSEWMQARKDLLAKEKEFTIIRDQLNQKRRDLPWVQVDKEYVFDGPTGKQTLSELFDGRSQLIVYHFMYDPSWNAGCPSCSFWADNFDGMCIHLNHRDVTMIAVSRTPYNKIDKYKKRMGWKFKWVSSYNTDFNYDYHISFTSEELDKKKVFYNYIDQYTPSTEREGVSIFYKNSSGKIYHTYSTYARGIDILNTAYNYLDLVPKGRDEIGHEFPQYWVRRHDEYGK